MLARSSSEPSLVGVPLERQRQVVGVDAEPSSATRIRSTPPPSTSTTIRRAPASIAFSTSSLTHRGGPLDDLARGDPRGDGRGQRRRSHACSASLPGRAVDQRIEHGERLDRRSAHAVRVGPIVRDQSARGRNMLAGRGRPTPLDAASCDSCALQLGQDLRRPTRHRDGYAGQPRDVDTVAAVRAPGTTRCRNTTCSPRSSTSIRNAAAFVQSRASSSASSW